MGYIIGVDIGTGSIKALAVDITGKVITSSQITYPTLNPQEELCEQVPDTIWKAFVDSVKEIVTAQKTSPLGIAISSAMHSLILIGEGDQPISNVITWADNRAKHIAERLKGSPVGDSIYRQTGTPIHAMSPLTKIIWFKENQPEIFSKTKRFISIKEYIWYKLFNAYEADYSIASATGLMDIISLRWNTQALALAGITETQLSKLIDTNHLRRGITKQLAGDLAIDESTPFMVGASDGCMANLGSFAIEQGIGALTIGTSGAVRVASSKPVYNYSAMTFNYRLDKDTFICGGPTNNGGIVLKWYAESFLRKKLNTAEDYKELLDEIKGIPIGADGLIFLPFILGERAPVWNSNASGVFFGIRNHHTQSHFTRAVLEGVSMALYNIAESMENHGLQIDEINASGGFVRSTEWLKIMADIFGKKIRVVDANDASALGAAYMALKSLGHIKAYAELQSKTFKVIMPNLENFKYYQKQYKRYVNLYESLSAQMRENINSN
ncbi:gluconokinase [Chryseosolibacter indicus]|uniref:Gluconokinase n=1 Tax=Chryseosolibacter indicus TaxID=2782351 RepID=A0ABS5VVM0_9BACT|nr:gluconokinase [Chryseosolibacter indicus]MBT1705475.1 gluconokinase [Chryseosolibacter indicus]